MAEDGAKLEPGPGDDDVEAPGEGELAARVAALKASLAETEADVTSTRATVARVAAELRATEARAEREREEVAKAEDALVWYRMRQDPACRDWAGGLPDEVLAKVAKKVVLQTEEGWAAVHAVQMRNVVPEELSSLKLSSLKLMISLHLQKEMKRQKREGPSRGLFMIARVCKEWRKAQLKVGGPLHTQMDSDVIAPGSVTLAKWALAEGCPREDRYGYNMDKVAARYGQAELVKWLCGEGGFAMDEWVMMEAAGSGNLELVRWLRAEGCPWTAFLRDKAATKFGYTDDFGNLVEKEESDDEYGYDDSDEFSDDE